MIQWARQHKVWATIILMALTLAVVFGWSMLLWATVADQSVSSTLAFSGGMLVGIVAAFGLLEIHA